MAANQAPVASWNAPLEARLNEIVTFASTSVDPDGSIVSTSWEFSDDGRTRAGTSVSRSFAWPGLHAVTLRVRDDAGAQTSADFTILVHAPIMYGRAFAVATSGQTLADTGEIETPHAGTTEANVGEWSYGALRVGGLDASVQTYSYVANARATIGSVYIPSPMGYVLVTGIEA